MTPDQLATAQARLADQEWRLNNLYYVTDEKGHKVQFVMKPAQFALFDQAWYRNIILKARQLGFTTLIQIFMLDSCLFTSNLRCGVIAHSKDDAQVFFRDKIKFAYDNLPAWLRDEDLTKTGFSIPRAVKNDAGELLLSNNSSIRVGTSMRSGTIQILHVSEYGKICRKYPEKAKEVRTGAFPAVHEGSWIFVESTAEGRDGDFFRMSTQAENDMKRIASGSRPPLSPMEYKFHFFPWWKDDRYQTDPANVVIVDRLVKYFTKLRVKHGVELSAGQMAWYAQKEAEQGGDMKQEYPSTPQEAFEVSIEGAYFSNEMAFLRNTGRICEVPWEPQLAVNTFWDIGMQDEMTIWFHQKLPGGSNRLIDYYSNSGEGFDHYANVLKKKGYSYGTHYLPHDVKVRELGTEDGRSRKQSLELLGVRPIKVVKRAKNLDVVLDQINQVRAFLKTCYIDEVTCAEGIKALDSYRKQWDEKLGTWKKGPLHNWASHPCDSMRTGVVGFRETTTYTKADLLPEAVADY